jgi:predicted RNase H-related nuclease YkuK (DUF458 family)
MFKIDIDEIKQFLLAQPDTTKVYLGCDSEKINVHGVWYADYALVVVCHINAKNGCKIFGEVIREKDFDQKLSKPNIRLMTEVFKVSELYLKLADVLADRYVEIHLDLNPAKEHNSNAVLNQAIGYIRGTCNVIPLIKPKAFAASYAADRLKEVFEMERAI